MLLVTPPTKARTSSNELCNNSQLLDYSSAVGLGNLHWLVITVIKPSSTAAC